MRAELRLVGTTLEVRDADNLQASDAVILRVRLWSPDNIIEIVRSDGEAIEMRTVAKNRIEVRLG